MDRISTPWATACLAQLLSRHVVTEETQRCSRTDAPAEKEVDTVVKMKGYVHVGPFQAEILEGKISQAPAHDTHVMVVPIRHAEVKVEEHTTLTTGSKASFDSGVEYD